MAINIKEWEEKYPEVDKELLLDWITDLTVKGVPLSEQDDAIKKKYEEHLGITPEEPEEDESVPEKTTDSEPESTLPETYKETYHKAFAPKEDDQDEDDDDELDELEPSNEEETEVDLKKAIQKEREEEETLEVPFDNPHMEDLEVPEDDEDDEDFELEPTPTPRPKPRLPTRNREMVTRTITIDEYEEVMRPWKPFFDDVKDDPQTLVKLANQLDTRRMPPYMQLKSSIINHPIKDATNTKVQISVISETNAKFIEPKFVILPEAFDLTKILAEQGWWKESLLNFDIIINKMLEDRKALVSLVYILENYVELKQQSPFELSIPKELLTDSINNSFETIKTLITNNVITEMGLLRKDLQGEMGDVGKIVANNMTKFDTQIQEAVTKVMWKVKTDVENTNMEDIKRTLLYLLNKRSAGYNLGGAATAVLGIMLDDLERRLLETGFKLDDIKEYRKYTVKDLTYKLGYKGQSNVIKAISLLAKRKLVKIYENKTISL